MKIGYACICLSLKSENIGTNRSLIKKTLDSKGLDYVSEVSLLNAKDIIKILRWNKENGIYFFRLSSAIIPWGDKIDIYKLKDYAEICYELKKAGDYAKANGIRITCHPGPYVVLTSPNEAVVKNAISDLEMHALIFDAMGLSRTPYNKINIHCNGVYGDKKSAMDRFCQNFLRCSEGVRSRLTVEVDDKPTMYSVKDLMYIHKKIGIPIVFDYHHHRFCPGGLSEEEALRLAVSTWCNGIIPVVHYSESKSEHENNPKLKPQAHSAYIYKLPDTYGVDVDLMCEAKAKELAILPFIGYERVCEYSGLIKTEAYELS
jgi:UV DNA damage endonuclease